MKEEFIQKKKDILEGMLEYMRSDETDYNETHIERCRNILDSFYDKSTASNNRDEFLLEVETTVRKINALTEEVEDIIETGERESICLLIMKIGSELGYNEPDEDITEEWREW
jgi:hypothetical protein